MAFTKERAVEYLVSRGLSPVAAAGLVGNMAAESAMDPGIEERAPNRYGTRGFGLMQWTGPRRDALVQYAADHGSRPGDPYLQLDYLVSELYGSERKAGDMLANAKTADDANAATLAFLRPSGWTSADASGSHQYQTRLANTQALLGDGDEATTPAPATPAAMTPFTPAAPPQVAVAAADDVLAADKKPRDPYGDAVSRISGGLLAMSDAAPIKPVPLAPIPAPQMRRPQQTVPLLPTPQQQVPVRRARPTLWDWS